MKLRSGKRSLTDVQKLFQRQNGLNQTNSINSKDQPVNKKRRVNDRPRRVLSQTQKDRNKRKNIKNRKINKNKNIKNTSCNSNSCSRSIILPSAGPGNSTNMIELEEAVNLIEYGLRLSKEIKKLERKANNLLKESDKMTKELYELNRQMNLDFIKILEYKNQKKRKICCKTLDNMESDLREKRTEHRRILQESKIKMLESKRLFSLAKRKDIGEPKSEQALNVTKFAKNSKKFLGQDCGICMGPMEKNVRRCVINKCQHAFHLECFEEWAKMRTTCPYCRGEIEPGVDQIELPESLVQTISWADMTLTNVSGF